MTCAPIGEPGRARSRPTPGAGAAAAETGRWNEVILSLRADTITLALNGVAIYERQLDRATSRGSACSISAIARRSVSAMSSSEATGRSR